MQFQFVDRLIARQQARDSLEKSIIDAIAKKEATLKVSFPENQIGVFCEAFSRVKRLDPSKILSMEKSKDQIVLGECCYILTFAQH